MTIHCTIINDSVRDMASKLNLGASYTSNLISVWQSKNNSTEYPSIDELKSLITEQERANNEIGLAIPEYTVEEFDPDKPLAQTSKDNKIILRMFPKENPLGYFFGYINDRKNNTSEQKKLVFEALEKEGFHQEELRELITNTTEAYRFILWHEMSHLQNTDSETYWKNGKDLLTEDKITIEARATKDAWLKARVYRHKHPIVKQQTSFSNSSEGKIIASYGPEVKVNQTGSMNYSYNQGMGGKRADVKSDTTLEAIQNGERTATTRYAKDGNIEYWSKLKVGDIVEWHDKQGNKVKVRITKPLTKLPNNTDAEEWSKKEGWSIEHFNKIVKPEIEKGEAYQMEFEKIIEENPQIENNKVNNNMNNNANDVTKVPEIGTEVINANRENPRTKLAKDYNAVTRHDRVVMLARMFSKKVDTIVNEKTKEVAREMANELSKSNPSKDEIMRINARAMLFNDSIKGRRAAMEDATIKKIFESMKEDIEDLASTTVEDFEEEYGEGIGEYMVAEYNKILDNWYALLDEACIYIEKAENVRVTVEEVKENNKEVQGETSDSTQDEDANEATNNDDENGERVEGNGGWSFKVRFVDPRTSLSKDVKKILNSIVRFNSNGEIDVDDLGNTRYLDSEVAHAALINHLSNMIDADDFCVKDENGKYTFPALQKVAARYPWVNQVINALKHNPSAISSFYADFRKDYIPYWTQIFDKEKGEWKTVALNSPVALDSVMSEVIQNYEHGDTLEEDSLYTKSGKVNPKTASVGLEEVNNILSDIRDYDSEDDTEMVNTIVKNLRRLGFNTNKTVIGNLLNTENGINDVESVLHRIKSIYQKSVNLDTDAHLISSLNDDYSEIAKVVGLVSELNNVQSFREGSKTYYSYSAANYIDTLVKTIKNDDRRDSYIEREFGFTEWFRNSNGEWMSEWVNLLLNDEDVRFQFDTKELLSIDGKQYTDWEPAEIKKAFILEYFSLGTNKGSNKQYAWYNIPILSDSPVAKFIKFKRYTGKFVEQLLPLFRNVVKQELWRIKLVQDRAAIGASPIGNFDKVGTKFHFFPELNANDNEFLNNITELKKHGNLDAIDDYIDKTVLSIMNANFEVFLETNLGDDNKEEIASTLIADGTIKNTNELESALEEYFWNQAYATTQIIELTTTDLAFYKDGTDFQKRYKEVYAAGTKLNTNSPYGRKVERTIYLTDDEVTSNSYLDIKKSLDDAVKLGHITTSERDNILSKFKEVNVADAQAYRSISSMRAVLDMMGAWDDNMQKSYDRLVNGKWGMDDFNIIWQTIKPFVFTQIQKPDGLGGTMKVPHQNKNSEFLLLALHNVIASSLSKSPKLRAINRFMENHNIDVIQFESAVKAGKQGKVNINYSKDKLNTWVGQNVVAYNEIESAVTSLGEDLSEMSMYEIFKLGNDTLLDQNKLSQEEYNNRFDSIQPDEEEVYNTLKECALQEDGEYNPTVVHTIPYSDYSIQQPTPEHLFDVEAVFGSQFRNLIISDIPEDAIIKVNGKDMTKQEVVHLYHSLVVENLLEDYKKVSGKFSSIESLQKALLDSVKGNPKYGRDMLDALQLVEITDPKDSNKTIKVFNIPLDNPNTTTKIQELVTSMFKNAVTKQHIKGGACILVSSYGLNSDLHVLHGEDGSIKGIECYLPAYSKQFYTPFMTTKHTEDGEEYQELDIDKMPLELRKLVGYRIPTEDKYSMAPLIVKGFLPQQNGSAIMLPADITQIAGSDFDVDKMFLMLPEFRLVNKYNIKNAWNDFYASHPNISKQVDDAKWEAFRRYYERVLEEQPEIAEEIDVEDKDFRDWFIKESGLKTYDLVDNLKDEFAKWFNANKNNYITGTEVAKINYNTNKLPQEQSRQARNNMLIDISYGILTHKDTAEKIHNPGNFDKVKIAARIANIISSTNLMYQFAEANNIPIYKLSDEEVREAVCDLILKISSEGNLEVLDKFMKDHSTVRSQLTVDTFIYNHKQNMTGGKLIGIYANNTTMQAKYQASNLAIKDNYTFTINGRVISSLHDITAANGERISKNCANFSAASVDNVKDPVLADLMQNTNTASIAGFMLRAGMSIEEIGLLFSQPAVRDMVKSDGTLDDIDGTIDKMMSELENYGGSVDIDIRMHDFTSKELLMNCLNESLIHNVDGTTIDNEKKGEILVKQIEALLLMRHIMYIAEELNNLTSISRADSPNGAISTSIAGSKLQRRKVEIYNRFSTTDRFPIAGVSDAPRNNYVSVGTDIDTTREKLLSRRMPMLQTFYSLGIDLSGQILSKYFSQTSDYSDKLADTICDNADGGVVREKMLNNMYSELVEFALSKTRLFGDDDTSTFDEKRNYYLNEFYKTYIKVLAENPDIVSLNVFKKMTVDENNAIVMLKSGRITPAMKESLMRDFDVLLDSDNPAAQKLAIDLFMYAYYKEGFKFGPNSFGNFFSSNFISSFPEFIDTLRTMKYDMQEGSYFDRFLPQFYANHLNESGLVPRIQGKKKGDIIQANGMVSVKASLVLNENITPLGVYRSYPYIRIGRSIFALQQDGKDRAIYVPALVFGGEQKRGRVIYNANKTVEEMSPMSSINSVEEELPSDKVRMPLTGLEDSTPYSIEEGQGELKEPLC